MPGEDLGLKPTTVEEVKFEYSPLGKIFTKGLDEGELKNIEGKSKEQLKVLKDQLEKQPIISKVKNMVFCHLQENLEINMVKH